MTFRWIAALLLIAGVAAAASPEEELKFAQLLGRRGLDKMASRILDKLEKSRDPKAVRFGRYGKALLTKEKASVAKARFLGALAGSRKPVVTRAAVIALYEGAKPAIEAYVKERGDDWDARFLLGEMLQEYAEFLTGADYPETLKADAAKLVSENGSKAEELFTEALDQFQAVHDKLSKKVTENTPITDPLYRELTLADYYKARAWLRLALLYPSGPSFINRSEKAIDKLDDFASEHYNDTYGAVATLDLGECCYERAIRLGSTDDAENAINYFSTLFESVDENPAAPDTSVILAKAFYWHNKACNARARGDGKMKQGAPIFFEKTIRAGLVQREKLKKGADNPWALKALLEVAEAQAAQGRIDQAVSIAGEVLGAARIKGQRAIADLATAKLTAWVARMEGAGALDAGLLYQIGDTLAGQGEVANAVTFYEKAVGASTTEEDRIKWGYPAQLRTAQVYLRDGRYFVAAAVAWQVVDAYIKSGETEGEGAFAQVASEACNTARLAWKAIAEKTKRARDQQKYKEVRRIFRERFPFHRENSDAAFANAMEVYAKKDYKQAAELFREISPTSGNYWRAQRLVLQCYRSLARMEKDKAKAQAWHAKALQASEDLIVLAKKAGADPKAKRSLETAELHRALSLASLKRWEEAVKALDAFFAAYPGQFPKRGFELYTKVHALLALGRVAEAEKTLGAYRKTITAVSSSKHNAIYEVYLALVKQYKALGRSREAVVVAQRAADLLDAYIQATQKPDFKLLFRLGDAMRAAHRWKDAGDAFEAAAAVAPDKKQIPAIKLWGAEMKFKAAKESDLPRKEYLKILEDTRKLYTEALFRKPEHSKTLLTKLARSWPSKAEWEEIRRNAPALLAAAEIYRESSPFGLDGRWIAVRLLQYIQTFTVPVHDEGRKALDAFIPTWWNAAQLMAEIYLQIAESGTGPREKKAAKDGYAYAKRLLYQYRNMDSPERVRMFKALEAKLQMQGK